MDRVALVHPAAGSRARPGSTPSSAVAAARLPSTKRTGRGASSATAARGVRGRPRKATPNSRTAASAARPTDKRGQSGNAGDQQLQAKLADPSRRQQRLEQQPESGKAETGRQHGDGEQPDQAASGGDRHAVDQSPQAVEPARAGAALRRVGAPQQQRPAQHVADQRQPRRVERLRCDRWQIDRAREQRHAECHRPPSRTDAANRPTATACSGIRERRAQRSDRGDGGTRQQQRHAPPQRLRRSAEVEQHPKHQISGDRRADAAIVPAASQDQQQHRGRAPAFRRRGAQRGELGPWPAKRECHGQADRAQRP